MINKPGPAQVGAISKAQKWQKDIKVSKYSFYSTKNCFLKKVSQRRKNERGDPLGFFYTQSVAKPKTKLKGGPSGENFFSEEKVSQCRKKLKGGSLWSRPALYVMRETFWFCSLGQQVKFEIL